ncbi:MAG: thioredoxin family protein [Cyclobacteriaceae bacterium]
MKRQVEIFTANCPVCDPMVKTVKDLACAQCDIIIYDLVKQCDDKTCLSKLEEYQIKRVPAIAVNGKLLNCCQDQGISQEELMKAGVGQGS